MQKNTETPEAQSKNSHAVNNTAVRIGLGVLIALPWVIWVYGDYRFYGISYFVGLLFSFALAVTLIIKGFWARFKKEIHFGTTLIGVFIFFAFSIAGYLTTSTSAFACAEASNTVSELRGLKAAALMYATDHPNFAENLSNHQSNYIELIKGYMDNPAKYLPERCSFRATPEVWWVGYNLSEIRRDTDTREKLNDRAPRTELYGSPRLDITPVSTDIHNLYQVEDNIVWMPIPIPHAASGDTAPPRP